MTNAQNRPLAELYVVATPIGQADDLSPRAAQLLREAELVIGEEWRELTTLLKRLGRERKQDSELAVLNEHTRDTDWTELLERMRALPAASRIALVSDCGTPGFCDPGGKLVGEWRALGGRVTSIPGASSLMCLLALSGIELREFNFVGFPPAEREARQEKLTEVVRDSRAQVLMDTPYRLQRLLEELAERAPQRVATLGTNFTCSDELVLQAKLTELLASWMKRPEAERKAEFMILLHPLYPAHPLHPGNSTKSSDHKSKKYENSKAFSANSPGANSKAFRGGPGPRPLSASTHRSTTKSPSNHPTKPTNPGKNRRGR